MNINKGTGIIKPVILLLFGVFGKESEFVNVDISIAKLNSKPIFYKEKKNAYPVFVWGFNQVFKV